MVISTSCSANHFTRQRPIAALTSPSHALIIDAVALRLKSSDSQHAIILLDRAYRLTGRIRAHRTPGLEEGFETHGDMCVLDLEGC